MSRTSSALCICTASIIPQQKNNSLILLMPSPMIAISTSIFSLREGNDIFSDNNFQTDVVPILNRLFK